MYRSGDTPTTFPFTKSPGDFSRVRPETNASKLYDNFMTITTIFDFIMIMAGSAIGKMKRLLSSDLLPERAKCAYMYVTAGTKCRTQIIGHKCRINYRSLCYGKQKTLKASPIALITIQNRVLASGYTTYLSY